MNGLVLHVRIDKEGRYFLNQEKEPTSGEQLSEKLQAEHTAQGSEVRVVLHPGPQAPPAAVIAAQERVRATGIEKVTINEPSAKGPAPHGPVLPGPTMAKPMTVESGSAEPDKAGKREENLAKVKLPPRVQQKAEQLPVDEREAFERNKKVWFSMPKEERVAIRDEAKERIAAETEAAYANSGLNLSPDQREVFDLRYRQERRQLEREIQEKARAERARRLPEIIDRLKRELAATAAAGAAPKSAAPKPTPTAQSTATPSPAAGAPSPAA